MCSDAMIALGGVAMLRDLLESNRHIFTKPVVVYATKMIIDICNFDNFRGNMQSMLDQNIMSCMFKNVEKFAEDQPLLEKTAGVLYLFSRAPANARVDIETRHRNTHIIIQALRLNFENPKLCILFCDTLSNMGVTFDDNFGVMLEKGLCSYAILALRYHKTGLNSSAVHAVCSLLCVLVVNGELGTNTSLAPMIVTTALTDLQHVMSCFIDDHDIQNMLVFTLMPILCKHANTNDTTGMHAIVVFVLECMRIHLHIHSTFTTIGEQTCTLANGFVLLWKMITDRSQYISIIRMHHGRELLEFVQEIHTQFRDAPRGVQEAISNVNMLLSTSDPIPDF